MSDINSGPKSSSGDESEYEVETILGHRKKHLKGAVMEYKIRWKGFDESYDTWEPEGNLDCKAMLAEYHKMHPKFENKMKNKRKRKRSVTEVEGNAAAELPINEITVKPLSPMPSDAEEDDKKVVAPVRGEKQRPTKKKIKKEKVDLDDYVLPELQGTPPIKDRKKKNKKLSGVMEENLIPKSTENNRESSEMRVIESKSPTKKRPRIRVTKKRRETEAVKDQEKNVNSALSDSTVPLSQPESTENTSEVTSLLIGEVKQPLQPTKTNLPKVARTEVPPGSDSTKENSLPGENQRQTEDQNGNTRAVSLTKHKSGFDQGLVPDEIVGATNIGGFKFLLKWKGHSKMEFVDNETAKKKIPLLVINFYEARIHFDHKDVPLNSPFHPLATGDGNL